jgi:hypothetical protein
MAPVPLRLVKKIGSKYYAFHLKGRYDEKDELEMSLRAGHKTTAKKEAESYRKWQNSVNNAHAIVMKHGAVYCVYTRSDTAFRSMKDAKDYLALFQKEWHGAGQIREWLKERGY